MVSTPQSHSDEADIEAEQVIESCLTGNPPRSFFLYAGAGSGKTRSLVNAVKKLKTEWYQRLVFRAQKIAVITYTNAACEEISRRLDQDPLVFVSTIHSFAWRLIKGFDDEIREWLRVSIAEGIQSLEAALAKSRGENKTTLERRAELDRKRRRLERLDEIATFTYSPSGDNRGRESLNHSEVIQMTAQFIQTPPLRDVLVDLHPVLLIDESQDTNRLLMDAFLAVQQAVPERFCLGLLGDTMQRIYADGKERLEEAIPEGWAKPVKRMNHRSPRRVVDLINRIRADVDGQVQNSRGDSAEGVVRIFLPVGAAKGTFELEGKVATLMADISGDAAWAHGEHERKTLILEHKMAARRMRFEGVFEPLYAVEHLRTSLLDGTLSSIKFLLDTVCPVVDAGLGGDDFALVNSVCNRTPLLDKKVLKGSEDQLAALRQAGEGAASLIEMFRQRDPLLIEVVSEIQRSGLLNVPEILADAAAAGPAAGDPPQTTDRGELELHAYRVVLGAPFSQIRSFKDYSRGLSPFDTHQGVKGLEFPRVMVIMNDDEAGGFLFSYEKLLGAKAPSERDVANEQEGKDSTLRRTRRLLYVTSSRAQASLAWVVYSQNPEAVKRCVVEMGWFDESEVVFVD
jgi:Superfamily I DNA and RNA helicases